MIKGDLRKKQILETAEKLFTEKGYQTTSVQDILDELGLSKGSFYHHFESKEYLLEAMCDRRAVLIAHQAEEEEQAFVKPIARLNSLLSGVFPLKDERLSFLMMILPVFSKGGLYETYIKSNNYGTYSKLNNFEVIFNSLKEKELMPTMSRLVNIIEREENIIKKEFIKSKTMILDTIINHLIKETI